MQTFVYPDGPDGPCDDCDSWDFVDDHDLLLSFSPAPAYPHAEAPAQPQGPMPALASVGALAQAPGKGHASAQSPTLGPAPSEEEAADATRLLRDSMHAFMGSASSPLRVLEPTHSAASSDAHAPEGSSPDCQAGRGSEFSNSMEQLVATARANAAGSRRAVVARALHLFTVDENMQRVVKSLACDSAVWHAVSSNPEVQRLLNGPRLTAGPPWNDHRGQLLASGQGQDHGESGSASAREEEGAAARGHLGASLLHVVQQLLHRLTDLKSSILGLLGRLLGFAPPLEDGTEGRAAGEEDPNWHLLPGITALAVLVIGIIVLKRPIIL